MSIFEALMLLCFGAAWPVNIYKSLKSKSTTGKSLLFLIIVDLGYVSGIIHKLVFSYDLVLYLYILNLAMVSFDMFLYFRYRRREQMRPSNMASQ
jgi:hypothetical protein